MNLGTYPKVVGDALLQKMNERDAANLLIAVNGCALAKDVKENLPLFRDLRVSKAGAKNYTGVGERWSTLGDDLETLIKEMGIQNYLGVTDDYPGSISIRFERPILRAEIFLIFEEKWVEDRFVHVEYGSVDHDKLDSYGDRLDQTIISHKTLIAVARALAS